MEWVGVESRESREALLADLARNAGYWTGSVRALLEGRDPADPEIAGAVDRLRAVLDARGIEALTDLVGWVLSGATHSALVTLDGGSVTCPTLELRDPDGRSLGDALHEEWPDFDPREAT